VTKKQSKQRTAGQTFLTEQFNQQIKARSQSKSKMKNKKNSGFSKKNSKLESYCNKKCFVVILS
jgi:hypothetical protein